MGQGYRALLLARRTSNHHSHLASLLPPPSCAGGIRRAIAVPNAGGRERLIFADPSPAATRRNRCSPERASARREVEAAQRASHVWDGCRPGSLLLSVLDAVLRMQLGRPHRGRPSCTCITRYLRVVPRVHPTCIFSCARKVHTMTSCASACTSSAPPVHFVCPFVCIVRTRVLVCAPRVS